MLKLLTDFIVNNCFHHMCVDASLIIDNLLGECTEVGDFFVGDVGSNCCKGHLLRNDN